MRRVHWSAGAEKDYADILEFAAERDPGYAERLEERILAAVALLAERPIGRPNRMPGVSQKLVLRTPYIIAYRATEIELTILRVIHQSRDWRPGEWPEE